MEVIVYKNDTGIAVIHPTGDIEYAMKDIPDGAEYKIIDVEDLPSDRTFRSAWTYDLKEDIEKSKEIWKDKLRAERAPLLSALDIEYQRADEIGDSEKKSVVAAEKQILRDVTNLVDNCKTIDEIKEVVI